MPATDLVVQAKAQGFEQSLIVNAAPAQPLVIDLPISVDGATATLDDSGALILTDHRGVVIATAPTVQIWGASTDPETQEPIKSEIVPTSLVSGQDGSQILELRPDPAFFTDPAVTYPVTIDPTVDVGVVGDTFVSSAQPNTTFGTDSNLKSGLGIATGSPVFRSLLIFNIDSSLLGNVSSASLDLWENFAPNCTARSICGVSLTSSTRP